MATTFRLEHDFPDIPIELFEKYLNHPELIAMLGAMPAFRSRDLVEKKDLGGGTTGWRFKVVAGGAILPVIPDIGYASRDVGFDGNSIPPAARRVVSEDMLTWHEDTRFVPAEHTIYWSIVPLSAKFREILDAKGIWKLTPHSYGAKMGTRRVIEGTISVKMTLVGKIVESFLAEELKKNYDVEPDIQRRFYRDIQAKGG